jgi:hypothetical protein
MRWIRTKEQKDNLAKYCWDISKIAVAALGIAPLAKPETVDLRAIAYGLLIGVLFGLFGYILDGKEVRS